MNDDSNAVTLSISQKILRLAMHERLSNSDANSLIPAVLRFARQAGISCERVICTACILLALTSAPLRAQEKVDSDTLPTLNEMQRPPSFEKLMTAAPFDWVVLKQGDLVITCEALSPRPDTLAQMEQELTALRALRRTTEQQRDRIKDLQSLVIHLPDDLEDYSINVKAVKEIIGIEDLMLERADLLIKDGNIAKAYDLLQRVDQTAPNWDKAKPHFARLLLAESAQRLEQQQPMAALALLDEVRARSPEHPDLPDRYSSILKPLIGDALQQENFGKVRWLAERLSRHFPEHSLVRDTRTALSLRADSFMDQAVQLSNDGDHRAAVFAGRKAEAIQPSRGNQRNVWNRILARHQVLRVAVSSAGSSDNGFPIPLSASQRHQELTTVPLFEANSVDELTHYESTHIEEWEPTDLGREVTLILQTARPHWQTQPLLSASQVADTLSAYLTPQDELYNPRLASFVAGYSVRSPTRIEVRFARVPLNMAALFRFPIIGTPDDDGDSHATERTVLSTRFRPVSQTDQERRYERTIPEPDGLTTKQYHVAEIVERQYDTRHEQLQAFIRNEADVLPDLYPWEVDPVVRSGHGLVQKLAIPHTHVIAFNPASEPVRNPQLRRAISLSVDREGLLKRMVLRDDTMKYGRRTAAPWHNESYARSPLVDPPQTNLRLAFALRFAAEEQLRIPEKRRIIEEARKIILDEGGKWDEAEWRAEYRDQLNESAAHIKLPTLRMICEPDELMDEVTRQMVLLWKKVGIEVELVTPKSLGNDTKWDMMYRRVAMEEPLFDLWSVLLTDQSLDVNLLQGYPDWLRQELTRLDYAGSARSAQDQLYRIQRDLTAQAFLIPLWEIDRFTAFGNNVSGFPERPLSTYDNVERWVVHP